MNKQKDTMRVKLKRNLAGIGLGLFVGGALALPASDLETPAIQSSLAANYLLLDVDEAGDRLVAVGARGHVVYSDDQGKNWTQSDVPVSVMLTSVDFVNERKGWAVGHAGVILHTEDGGATWRKQFDGNMANEFVIEGARERVAALEEELALAEEIVAEAEGSSDAKLKARASEYDLDEMAFILEDATFALEDAEIDAESGAAKPLLSVQFLDENVGFTVGAFGFFFYTEDGGATWQYGASKIENTDRFHLNAVSQIDESTVAIAGEAGQIFLSRDRGATWESLESPYEGSFFGIGPTGNEGGMIVYGLRGNTFASNDYGANWEPLELDISETLMSSDTTGNGRISLVGNGGMLLLSRDGGETFTAHPREDRKALLGVRFLAADRLLLVGEDGISLIREVSRLN